MVAITAQTYWCVHCRRNTCTVNGICVECNHAKPVTVESDKGLPLFQITNTGELIDHEAIARDRGIELVTGSQSAVWVSVALSATHQLARSRPTLTADDVWEAIANINTDTVPNRSAMAGVLKRAASFKYIKATDRSVASRGEGRHRSRVAVWESLIHAK